MAWMVLLLPITIRAANLRPEAAAAWDDYVQQRNPANSPADEWRFLPQEDDSGTWAALRSGRILVTPASPAMPQRVPCGLIHDWIGTEFIPDTNISQVLATLRDYAEYKRIYQPGVVDSRTERTSDQEDRFSLLLINKSFFQKKAIEGDYRVTYGELDQHRWYSVTESTRIQEVDGFGGPGAHVLPEGEGTGLMWRVHTITRFEEWHGGVLIQFEAMVLSRDVPGALRWIADPIIRRVSKESVQLSLEQTRNAIKGNQAHANTALRTEPNAQLNRP